MVHFEGRRVVGWKTENGVDSTRVGGWDGRIHECTHKMSDEEEEIQDKMPGRKVLLEQRRRR